MHASDFAVLVQDYECSFAFRCVMNLKIVFTRVAYGAYWLVAPLCIEATENQVYRLDSDSELVLCQWLGSDLQNDSGEPEPVSSGITEGKLAGEPST